MEDSNIQKLKQLIQAFKSESKPVCADIPKDILDLVDGFASSKGIDRTTAIKVLLTISLYNTERFKDLMENL